MKIYDHFCLLLVRMKRLLKIMKGDKIPVNTNRRGAVWQHTGSLVPEVEGSNPSDGMFVYEITKDTQLNTEQLARFGHRVYLGSSPGVSTS